jgi:hypothetical protein
MGCFATSNQTLAARSGEQNDIWSNIRIQEVCSTVLELEVSARVFVVTILCPAGNLVGVSFCSYKT